MVNPWNVNIYLMEKIINGACLYVKRGWKEFIGKEKLNGVFFLSRKREVENHMYWMWRELVRRVGEERLKGTINVKGGWYLVLI